MALQCKQTHKKNSAQVVIPQSFPKPCPQAHTEMAMVFAGGET